MWGRKKVKKATPGTIFRNWYWEKGMFSAPGLGYHNLDFYTVKIKCPCCHHKVTMPSEVWREVLKRGGFGCKKCRNMFEIKKQDDEKVLKLCES